MKPDFGPVPGGMGLDIGIRKRLPLGWPIRIGNKKKLKIFKPKFDPVPDEIDPGLPIPKTLLRTSGIDCANKKILTPLP